MEIWWGDADSSVEPAEYIGHIKTEESTVSGWLNSLSALLKKCVVRAAKF